MTYREVIYSILDLLKQSSDDSFYTEEHVLFLVSKIRAAILKQSYANIKRDIPESNYQTICLDLMEVPAIAGEPCEGGSYLKSVQKIPTALPIGNTKLYPINYYQGGITYVSRERMKYVGYNKWLQNIIYASLGPDQYIYLKSSNPQYLYLKQIKMTGIFEDTTAALELQCGKEGNSCDELDVPFPLEEGLVPTLIEMALKFLSGSIYKPEDPINNASDDLSELATFLRQNMKSKLQQQIEG